MFCNNVFLFNITDWTQCFDKITGHPYYWNTISKEVTWEIPTEYQGYLDSQKQSLSDVSKRNAWIICYADDEKATPYYVNEYTREVSWEKPINFVETILELPKVPQNSKATQKEIPLKAVNRHLKPVRKYPFKTDDIEDEYVY